MGVTVSVACPTSDVFWWHFRAIRREIVRQLMVCGWRENIPKTMSRDVLKIPVCLQVACLEAGFTILLEGIQQIFFSNFRIIFGEVNVCIITAVIFNQTASWCFMPLPVLITTSPWGWWQLAERIFFYIYLHQDFPEINPPFKPSKWIGRRCGAGKEKSLREGKKKRSA